MIFVAFVQMEETFCFVISVPGLSTKVISQLAREKIYITCWNYEKVTIRVCF